MSAVRRRMRCAVIPFVFVAMLVTSLAITLVEAPPAEASTRQERKVQRKIAHSVKVARSQLGDPYRYGAAGPNAFDCSGLTSFAYHRAGLALPRTSDAQFRFVRKIPKSKIRRGDLMFFLNGGDVYHVGIFLGRVRGSAYILHAPNSGEVVHRARVWTGQWRAGTVR